MYKTRKLQNGEFELVARVGIPEGATVWKYSARRSRRAGVRVLTLDEIAQLAPRRRATFTRYCWQRDATHWEGSAEAPRRDTINFINHSCDPNLWFDGDYVLRARRGIQRGEALTIDYATCDSQFAAVDMCWCSAANCRGSVRNTDYLDVTRYSGHVRSFITVLKH